MALSLVETTLLDIRGKQCDHRWSRVVHGSKDVHTAAFLRQGSMSRRLYDSGSDAVFPRTLSLTAGERFCRRFKNKKLNRMVADAFEHIAILFPDISLSPFDLHHGHIVFNKSLQTHIVLFHANEYPRHDEVHFPAHLGRIQQHPKNDLVYTPESFCWRNVVWIDSYFARLHVGRESPLHDLLTSDHGIEDMCYIDESRLGRVESDVYYIPKQLMPTRKPEHRIFIVNR